ncbi:hypothetical protein ACQ3I4_08705 [Zafaria sp. Z1313]|uniref:hypothetical protein n=1 Tax=Zafaria sp. Z1313 TaxID=3423202 RepID=UPI003D30322C
MGGTWDGARIADPDMGEEVEDRAGSGLSRRRFGLAMGAAIAAGAGGLSAAVTLLASGPPGTVGVPTSFGAARITSAQRQARLAESTSTTPAGHAGAHAAAGSTSPQPVNMTYGDHLLLRLEIANDTDAEIAFSPGLLRVLPNSEPWWIVNRRSDLHNGAIPPGGRVSANISFLVPSNATRFSAEFTDVGQGVPVRLELPVPSVSWRPGYLEAGHDAA